MGDTEDRTNTVRDVAETFMAASQAQDWEAMAACMAPGAELWQNLGRPAAPASSVIRGLQRFAERVGGWMYEDRRLLVSANGFCEQHTVRFGIQAADEPGVAACVVGRVNDTGRITLLEEYLDSASLPL